MTINNYTEQEKAEKYDSLMNANNQQIKENISNTQIYQENGAGQN